MIVQINVDADQIMVAQDLWDPMTRTAPFDLMSRWAPDEATRNRILVQNPVTPYGLPKLA